MDKEIELALRTWYDEDHPLHFDPLQPAIGLAGEAGELLDLYKKERFKDGFSWWDCAHCKIPEKRHSTATWGCPLGTGQRYTPKILDELGDLWYYLRILAYQSESDLSMWVLEDDRFVPNDMFMFLTNLNYQCAGLLLIYGDCQHLGLEHLQSAFSWFQDVLYLLDYTLDQLTELNWQKLKDGDNNGWEKARTSVHR